MGYTVYYEGISETPITDEEWASVNALAAETTARLSEAAESMDWDLDGSRCEISGSTKPGFDDEDLPDVELIVAAVRLLSQRLPDFAFTVTDDYGAELFP